MEDKRLRKEGRSSLDIISTLPQTILETILCLLPTKEAARTSILSREWRYKWTQIPKLEFHLPLVSKRITKGTQVQGQYMDMRCEPFYSLHKILLSHTGPIHEFTLHIDLWRTNRDPEGFDQIILYLSKNHTIKKLKLTGGNASSCYSLPMSVFSMHQLTDLYLCCVDLDYLPIFDGFSSLRSLVLVDIGISTETLVHLLSNCPSLKSLDLIIGEAHRGDKYCTITELFECLPVVECLATCTDVFRWLVLDLVPKKLPTSLFHLKHFCFDDVCFSDGYGLAFLLVLIKCSPNLEKIDLKIEWDHECFGEYTVVWEEYSDVWLEHLSELEIDYYRNSTREMEFVLARSPKLKKVTIRTSVVSTEERLEMLTVLLRAPRASPVVIYV